MLHVFFLNQSAKLRQQEIHIIQIPILLQGFPVTELITCVSSMSFEAGITPRPCSVPTTLNKIKAALTYLEGNRES